MELKFDEKGLIPAAVTESNTGKLLMLAYMNKESLRISMEEGRTCFWSRSRNELWRKGEISGHVQRIAAIRADCDGDALEVSVQKAGPACHTGADSCFLETLYENPAVKALTADALYELIRGRKSEPREGSYTSYLFEKGIDKILKKIGEEASEVIIAAKGGDSRETVYEIADLFYHILVLMAQMEIPLSAVREELAGRHVVDHKVKQEKMA